MTKRHLPCKYQKPVFLINPCFLLMLTSMATLAQTQPLNNPISKDDGLVMPNPGKLSKATTFDPQLRQLKYQSWYDKLSTFIWLGNEYRNIAIDRRSTITDLDHEKFTGNYNAQVVSLTVGGNLWQKTSFHADLTLTRLKLDGLHQAVDSEAVEYQRNKTLLEVFVDHQLFEQFTVGADFYYGGDHYRNINGDSNERIYDEEMGAGMSLTTWFDVMNDEVTLKYIYSSRKVNMGNTTQQTKRSFHSALANLHHQWRYDWSSDINLRWSYYPVVDEFRYWEAKHIWAIGSELTYRSDDHGEVSLNLNHLAYGDNSFTNTVSLNYRYRFGNASSKRRQRGQKIPRLLIK